MRDTDFISLIYQAAIQAGHPFPDITAAEAAFETDFGYSALATRANNLFKLRSSADYDFMRPRIKLFVPSAHNSTQLLTATYWTEFASHEDCIRQRYEFLKFRSTWDAGITEALRLAELAVTEPTRDYSTEYITSLSKNIIGPKDRADQVLVIRDQYREVVCKSTKLSTMS